MIAYPQYHSITAKTFLGQSGVINIGSLNEVIDAAVFSLGDDPNTVIKTRIEPDTRVMGDAVEPRREQGRAARVAVDAPVGQRAHQGHPGEAATRAIAVRRRAETHATVRAAGEAGCEAEVGPAAVRPEVSKGHPFHTKGNFTCFQNPLGT